MMRSVSSPTPLSDEQLERLHESYMTSPFNKLLGIDFGDYHDDGVSLRLQLGEHHMNGAGVVHGGVLLTLADAALGYSIARAVGGRCTTAEVKINYLRPVITGEVIARARVLRKGRKLVVARAQVHCDGRHVAEVLTTFAVLD